MAIIGLGNPLRGDDGIGPRVVQELARCALPPGTVALDGGTAGLGLLGLLNGWDRVIVVDAADVGQEAGQFVRFRPDQARLAEAIDGFSFHHAGLAEVLALACALDQPLPPLVVFGVQPGQVGWQEGLSAAVEASLPALVEAILREVGEDQCPRS